MNVLEKVSSWMCKHRSKSFTTTEISAATSVDPRYCLRVLKVLKEQAVIGNGFGKWYWEYKAVPLSPLMLNRALKRCEELSEQEDAPLLDIKQELNDIRANRAKFNGIIWSRPNAESWCNHVEKKFKED